MGDRTEDERKEYEAIFPIKCGCDKKRKVTGNKITFWGKVDIIKRKKDGFKPSFCDPLGVRTQDPHIKSVMLYRLS